MTQLTLKTILERFDEDFVKEKVCRCCGKNPCDYSTTGCPWYEKDILMNEDGTLAGNASNVKQFITQQITELIETMPLEKVGYAEHMKSKRAFDEGNGYNKKTEELKQWKDKILEEK